MQPARGDQPSQRQPFYILHDPGPGRYISLDDPRRGGELNASGDLDILASLTLHGAGMETTILRAGERKGDGIDRVLEINEGTTLTVQAAQLTIQHGEVKEDRSGDGMAIHSPNSEVTLSRVKFKDDKDEQLSQVRGCVCEPGDCYDDRRDDQRKYGHGARGRNITMTPGQRSIVRNQRADNRLKARPASKQWRRHLDPRAGFRQPGGRCSRSSELHKWPLISVFPYSANAEISRHSPPGVVFHRRPDD